MDLLVRLGVGWHGEGGVLGLKAVLGFDGSSCDESLEVTLHGLSSIVLCLIRVVVCAFTAGTLRLLRIQLRLVWLCTATSLSHFL